jgi:Uma2 family endonuclease
MASTSSLKLTYEDYELFPEDGRRHELVGGEHYVSPAPSLRHQAIVVNLVFAFKAFLQQHPLGRVFVAPTDLILSASDVVQPDLLFVSRERSGILGEKNVQGAPDLLVEIVSETNRKLDEITKRKLYEHHGVQEYWVVDPAAETVKVYRREDTGFGRAALLSAEAGDVLATPLLPGLAIPLSAVFA